ncbi:MAG: M20/M25/M40 family metallo-hydrolase [Firmicutes bacterium]|nr:M20/M25/M40 family metallo-hydrolase [Bacillota bacterium]
MAEFRHHLETLAVHIGPRGSATKEEEAAAEYVAAQIRSFGLECQRQRFPALTSFSWTYLAIMVTGPLAAALFLFRPGAAFLLALLGSLAYLCEASTFPFFGRLIPKRKSINVIAKAHARSKELRRVLILAHLDSSRAGLSFSPRMVTGFRSSFLLNFLSLPLQALLYGVTLFWPGAPRTALWWFSLLPAAVLLWGCFTLVHRELWGKIVPGANDDASGLAVLLETARVIARSPLLTTSVWFVATGAEESGLWGALHLIRECAFDPKKTMVINLDNLGRGRLTFTFCEGIVFPLRVDPRLIETARETAAEKNLKLDLRPYHLLPTDATAFLARRIPAGSIMAFDERGLLPNWHWPTDTIEHVDEANLAAARDLVLGMLRRLEE